MDINNQFENIKEITKTQKQTWSKGDFNEISRQNVVMAESLCQEVDPYPGQKILDIACGSGTAALVASRRYCEVTGIDYVPELIDRARNRAKASGLKADFQIADAQNLPFQNDSFDAVISVYGAQFAPDQEKTASEMLRVCRPGGKIGLASPMPEGWSGDFFATHGKYIPPPAEIKPPLRWGTDKGLSQLLNENTRSIKSEMKTALQYYLSTDHAVEIFSTWFGPTIRVLEKIDDGERESFLKDLKKVFKRYNLSTNGTAIIENTYLQSIAFCD
ncbi:MAG: class I SAM-dependent methyltransferase [Balneolaceae bacterium]